MIDYSIHHRDKNTLFKSSWFINFYLSDFMPILFALLYIINAHKCLTEILSPTLSCPIFNNTASSILSPNLITANISGYTAIVAIPSMDIATANNMLWTCTFQ